MCKIFVDDKSLFPKVLDIKKFVTEFISQWAYQWKMGFNPDLNKQANEIIFSRKLVSNNLLNPPVKITNNNNIIRCPHKKHLGVVLGSNLNLKSAIKQLVL